MPYFNQEEILAKTNGGLDIITRLCPGAINAIQRNQNFKIREDEKTASASIKQMPDGVYVVTDWGGDAKQRNGILLWSFLRGVDFKTTLQQIASEFGIMPEEQLKKLRQPEFNKRKAKPKENEGEYMFDVLPAIPPEWVKVIGPYADVEKLMRYHWKAVQSYSLVKNREVLTWSSREDYPIFIIEEEGFKKIYQPLAFDKKKRFRYAATDKPKDFLHGLQQARQAFYEKNPHEADGYSESEADAKNKNDGNLETEKLPEIIICSGDRDAMNVAGMGYYVVWKNSESAKITGKAWKEMNKYADVVYNLPDIDTTGIRQGHSLAMFYLNLRTIWLPKELLNRKDWRGNPRKDLLDFCEVYRQKSPAMFKDLLKVAYPYRFWDVFYTNDTQKFDVNNVYLYNFLAQNGFHRYEMEGVADGFVFIHIKGNVVKEVNPIQVRAFINNFLAERHEDVKLRNHFFRSRFINNQSMENLPTTAPDFVSYSKTNRFFFFQDKVFEVNKEEVRICRPGTVDKYVWSDQVIDHNLALEEDFFKVDFNVDEHGRQHINDITIQDHRCLFLRYLIQTSRIYWREELDERTANFSPEELAAYRKKYHFRIDGELLTNEEVHEQKLHLVNKMYAIGYILHRYRQMSRAWVPYAMDNRLSDQGESYGGSGKSILFNNAISKMSRMFYKGARDSKIFDDRHIFHGVTRHTDYILFDDAGEYLNFDFLFPYITGEFNVNPKNNQPFSIPFAEAPTIAITTNYTPRKTDPSTLRRLLFVVFSDYYHKEGEFYKEDMNPEIDFGKEILGHEFTEEEWNLFYNTMLQCLKLYLTLPGKVDPPMKSVEMRNLRAMMGDTFFQWAEVYFSPKGENLNKEHVKKDLMEEFLRDTNTQAKYVTPNNFKRKLQAFCKFNGLLFNPEVRGERIIKKIDGKATEMVRLEEKDFKENQPEPHPLLAGNNENPEW